VSVTGFLASQVQLGTVGFPAVCLGGGSVACCSPLVLIAVTISGGGGPFVLAGSVRMDSADLRKARTTAARALVAAACEASAWR
jgi:hypothetical protein